jgi:hypothetical protein
MGLLQVACREDVVRFFDVDVDVGEPWTKLFDFDFLQTFEILEHRQKVFFDALDEGLLELPGPVVAIDNVLDSRLQVNDGEIDNEAATDVACGFDHRNDGLGYSFADLGGSFVEFGIGEVLVEIAHLDVPTFMQLVDDDVSGYAHGDAYSYATNESSHDVTPH